VSPILGVYCDLIHRIAGWHWAQYCSTCITLISRGFVVHFVLQIEVPGNGVWPAK